MTTEGYFTNFCSFFGSDKCHEVAERAEHGSISKEKAFEWFLNTFGEEKVAEAHQYASNLLQRPNVHVTTHPSPTPAAPAAPPAPPPPPIVPSDMADKAKQLQVDKAAQKPNEVVAPYQKTGMPAAQSDISDLCRVCATPLAISVLEVLSMWFQGKDKEKILQLEDALGNETAKLEDVFTEIFTTIDGSLDGVNKTLSDFNKVLEMSLAKAAEKKPALRKQFLAELDEMQGGEAEE